MQTFNDLPEGLSALLKLVPLEYHGVVKSAYWLGCENGTEIMGKVASKLFEECLLG